MVKLLFFLSFIFGVMAAAPDPFSKITVTSKSATFQKDKTDKSMASLRYDDDVFVTFADATTVSSDHLEVVVDTKKTEKDSRVKKVIFTDNVRIKRPSQDARADRIEVLVPEKKCLLKGNVAIKQRKTKEKEVPITTSCETAQFVWGADGEQPVEEIEMQGSDKKPVSTTIELGGKLHERYSSITCRRSEKNCGR